MIGTMRICGVILVAPIIVAAALAILVAYPSAVSAQLTGNTGQSPPATAAPSNPFLTLPSVSTNNLFQQSAPNSAANQAQQQATLTLVALLTNTGPRIKRGVIWRIYTPASSSSAPTLISEHSQARLIVPLPAGVYLINAAFGLAHLTKTITLRGGDNKREKFIVNAGGLKILARAASTSFAGPVSATYDLFTDERNQFGKRKKILSNMRPGRITRLNSGIYRIVSRLGDANAVVASEVTVEAGKLTEATVIHEAAKVTFKLVQSTGGDALADAQWIIMTNAGKVIKETAGALPTHVLAPGNYTISARWGGKLHTRTFAVRSGDNVEVEVVIR